MNMEFTKIGERLKRTDRGVSPVIGVILMVAITVILAAVIGTFVLDLGQSAGQSGPTASLQVADGDPGLDSASNGDVMLVISHQGGDELDGSSLQITIRNTSDNAIQGRWTEGSYDNSSADNDGSVDYEILLNGGTMDAESVFATGDAITVTYNDTGNWAAQEYTIQAVDTETDTQVVSTTVELR